MHQNKILFILSLFLFSSIALSQKLLKVPDSLKNYTHDTFREKVYSNSDDNFTRNYIYGKSNLLKAKSEQNTREIIYGYDLLAEIFDDFNQSVQYSDSAIALARQKYPKALPYLYSTRGYVFYNKKRLKESLNCFLMALKDTIHLSDQRINNIRYSIGLIKKTQGNYSEALPIYKKCITRAEKIQDGNYLRYLTGLAELYNWTGNTEMSEQLTKKGIHDCGNYDSGDYYLPYFIANRGKNYLQRKNYTAALTDLKSTLVNFKKNNDFSNYAENCFYIGEAYTKLDQSDQAVRFYKKVDSIFNVQHDISLITIPAYEKMIAYYKTKDQYREVIFYSDQFIKADKVLDGDYKYITTTLAKKSDTDGVLSFKQSLMALKNEKLSLKLTILFLFLGVIILFSLLYSNNKKRQKEVEKQRQLFEAYTKEREQQIILANESLKRVTKKASIDTMDESVINHILDCLQKFESERRYIQKEYTIEMLAAEFKTNSKYLSKVINTVKDITFTQYINTLRIEYILNQLENDKKILNYTIQALSEICGYNSVQTFTRAFTAYTKMKPSDFIKELKANRK
ncbi:helix-turn-helix domain-containing protein [Flavobacterium sp. LC2016-23]|uniref:helix-turn-helix domain-containing protein n=1 Tax=Flavobacterium sp. LC2016-23 TaxID=2666330 RepID=UPI0012B0F737|nr:helix-turn-helix domain-containing protein [Flavobacterium sp. LC2016-23]MRX41317.1 helix-turn-helix domain-containing protein [Flavobacterium sp. LC2016-23]